MKISSIRHEKFSELRGNQGRANLLFLMSRPTALEHIARCFTIIHTDGHVSTKRLCELWGGHFTSTSQAPNLPGTRYGIANSITNSVCCCPRDLGGLGHAGYGRSTTTTIFIPSTKEGFCQSRSAGQPTRGTFAKSESGGGNTAGRVRVRHRKQTQAGIPDVWHANFQ